MTLDRFRPDEQRLGMACEELPPVLNQHQHALRAREPARVEHNGALARQAERIAQRGALGALERFEALQVDGVGDSQNPLRRAIGSLEAAFHFRGDGDDAVGATQKPALRGAEQVGGEATDAAHRPETLRGDRLYELEGTFEPHDARLPERSAQRNRDERNDLHARDDDHVVPPRTADEQRCEPREICEDRRKRVPSGALQAAARTDAMHGHRPVLLLDGSRRAGLTRNYAHLDALGGDLPGNARGNESRTAGFRGKLLGDPADARRVRHVHC